MKKVWIGVLVGVGILFVANAAGDTGSTSQATTPSYTATTFEAPDIDVPTYDEPTYDAPDSDATFEVTPEMVADYMEASGGLDCPALRAGIAQLGYDGALRAFEQGYGSAGSPSAAAVFAELESRC
jgi:hypothetical protein